MSPSQQLTIAQALSRAKKAAKQGNLAVAQQLYQAVLQHQPRHPIATQGLRLLQKELPRRQSLQAQTANPSQDQINALINLYHSGQMSQAEQSCRQLLQTYPQSLIVLNLLGAALSSQGQLQQAVQVFDKVIRLEPDYAQAYSNRGNALTGLGQLEEAVDSCNKAIELQPLAEAYYNRGNALTELEQLEAAVDSYDQAIRLKPDLAQAYYNRGNALNDLGKLVEAVACFNKVLEIGSDDIHDRARLQLARLGEGKMPDRTPESYMKSFYHSKAKVWGLATKGHYHGHQLVREAIDYVIEKEERLNILDLGCGTGSLADFLHSYASRLDGVDISPDMLERAAEREVYNNLVEEDLVQYLEETSNSYGLMVAAAVLIHFADLETVFSLVWDRLDEHGRFVFSLFKAAEEEVELNSFDMFAHSDQYIQQLVDRVGFRLCYQKEGIHESRGIHAVVGVVYLLEKNSGC